MTRSALFLISLLLSACASTVPESGAIHACIGGEVPDPYRIEPYESTWLYELTSSVISDEPATAPLDTPLSCPGTVRRVLTLRDGEGDLVQLAYGVDTPAAEDDTPALDVSPDDVVSVRYRAVLDFGSANGFVLTGDDGALIAAFEGGTWGAALDPADVPGLRVTSGDTTVRAASDCGRVQYESLRFAGDVEVDLIPYEVGSVPIGGQDQRVFAASSWGYVESTCPDAVGTRSWAVAR